MDHILSVLSSEEEKMRDEVSVPMPIWSEVIGRVWSVKDCRGIGT